MGRACMELWTNVHFVLKFIVLILMVIVEFLVFDVSTKYYYRFVYLEAYYLIVILYLVINLYGYIWFDTTPILESLMMLASIIMLIFTVIAAIRDHESKYIVYGNEQERFTIFIVLTLVAIVLLIIDLILLVMQALRKGPSFMKSSRSQRQASYD
ncbi:uncharacterized protein LOC143342107 [Colletes latitarsis]|uniref:uncharacterized protein LOC143342107 n=1 Tax=Colletes latitarsis TaxID=2605962 RepID=UPI00403590F7